jgi:hypothetical protein
MDAQPLESWPEHMQAIFALLGRLTGGKRLSRELLALLPEADGAIIAGHRVTIRHVTASELVTSVAATS